MKRPMISLVGAPFISQGRLMLTVLRLTVGVSTAR